MGIRSGLFSYRFGALNWVVDAHFGEMYIVHHFGEMYSTLGIVHSFWICLIFDFDIFSDSRMITKLVLLDNQKCSDFWK